MSSASGFPHFSPKFLFDALVDIALTELLGNADRILDGISVGAAMADDANAAHSQQRGAAILRIIHASLEGAERGLGNYVADLARDGGFERFTQQELHHVRHALADLEHHIADEAIAYYYVDYAGIDITAFHISNEI